MTSPVAPLDPLALWGGVAKVLPQEYAAYQAVLSDALALFVARLPAWRRAVLADAQVQLTSDATIEERLVVLMQSCPTLHKLGQVIARHQKLSPALRKELRRLESLEPRTPVAQLCAAVYRERPDLEELGVRLDGEALAEGSVATVIGFSLPQQSDVQDRRGVFKILKSGVVEALHSELAILSDIGATLDESADRYGLPALDYRETFEQVRDLLTCEVEFEHEQQNLLEAYETYGRAPGVQVPRLLPFCSPALTAMERVDGVPISAHPFVEQCQRTHAASRIVEVLLARPVLRGGPSSMFHADPHAGNLMLTEDDRLALIDWSLVGRLTKHAREGLVQVLLGAWTLDTTRILGAVEGLSCKPVDRTCLADAVDHAVSEVRRGVLPGLRWLIRTLDNLTIHAGVRFETDLVMFRKTLLTLDGLLAELDPHHPMDAELMNLVFAQFVSEAPARFWADPFSRSFATHLSNVDLMTAGASVPATLYSTWMNAVFPGTRKD